MYGQDEINIIYGDALKTRDEIKSNSFSILIANPPYSVNFRDLNRVGKKKV